MSGLSCLDPQHGSYKEDRWKSLLGFRDIHFKEVYETVSPNLLTCISVISEGDSEPTAAHRNNPTLHSCRVVGIFLGLFVMLSVSDEVFCGGIPASHSGNKIKDSIFKRWFLWVFLF